MLSQQPKSSSEAKRLNTQLEANMRKLEAERAKKSQVPFLEYNPELPDCVVIDIDGVLAQRGNRGIYDFEKSLEVDKPYKGVVSMLQSYYNAWKYLDLTDEDYKIPAVYLVTGREEMYREVTKAWLAKHDIPYGTLYMRRTGDRRPAAIVKEDIWVAYFKNKYNILFVLEDTKLVIDMYRSHGIYCLISDNRE